MQVGGGCIVTGEYIDGVESSRARRIELAIDRDEVDNVVLTKFQEDDIWPSYLYGMLAFVTKEINWLVDYIRTQVEQVRKNLDFKIGRRNEAFAQLCVMGQIMLQYGMRIGAISEEEGKRLYQEAMRSIYEVLHENEKDAQDVSPLFFVMSALHNYLVGNQEPENFLGNDTEKVYSNGEYYFVTLSKLMKIAQEHKKKTGLDVALPTEKILCKMLEKEGVLYTQKEGDKLRRTLHLPGKTSGGRFLWIVKDKLEDIVQKNGM